MIIMTENIIGNLTTIVKYISMLIAGWAIGIAVAHGLNLPIKWITDSVSGL